MREQKKVYINQNLEKYKVNESMCLFGAASTINDTESSQTSILKRLGVRPMTAANRNKSDAFNTRRVKIPQTIDNNTESASTKIGSRANLLCHSVKT